jgi:hypothetical protein
MKSYFFAVLSLAAFVVLGYAQESRRSEPANDAQTPVLSQGVSSRQGRAASIQPGRVLTEYRQTVQRSPSGVLLAGVRRLVPQQYSTIQAAINASVNGDTVLVSENTYPENIRFRGKAIIVASLYLLDKDTTHIEKTIIDGSGTSNPDSGSVVYFVNGEDTTSVLCGFTIRGGTGTGMRWQTGWARGGGGVQVDCPGAKIVRNIIKGNRVLGKLAWGGGVSANNFGTTSAFLILEENRIVDNYVRADSATGYAYSGGADLWLTSARVVGNLFERDTAMSSGLAASGAMSLYGPLVARPAFTGLIARNIFRRNIADGRAVGGNRAGIAGAVDCAATGDVTFLDNTFEANHVLAGTGLANGGGIYIDDEGILEPGRKTLLRNRFIGNSVQSQGGNAEGGGIGLYYAVATVSGNLISDNFASTPNPTGKGGGIRIYYSAYRLENNIITRNMSLTSGGGMSIEKIPYRGTEQVLVNNTIYDNNASVGGGLDIQGGATIFLFNNIFWADSATTGPEIYVQGSTTTFSYCDLQGGVITAGGVVSGPGNINVDPLFVVGDPLLNLATGSPCIGGGIDSVQFGGVWYHSPSSDYNGDARPAPGHVQGPDIGAQEEQITVDVAEPSGVPSSYILNQNYPNPFNPTTVIIYQVPAVSNVRLSVFDMLGREVALLVNEKKGAGRYEVKFDAAGLASGVYLYRLTAGGFVQSRKMLLVR